VTRVCEEQSKRKELCVDGQGEARGKGRRRMRSALLCYRAQQMFFSSTIEGCSLQRYFAIPYGLGVKGVLSRALVVHIYGVGFISMDIGPTA